MEVNDDRPEESAFLSAQVERLYSLLRQASLAERPLSTDEDRELAFWRQRVDAHEWAELERDAHMHASRSPSPGGTDPSPAREWLGSGERAPREERARFPGALPQAAPLADVHFDDGRASACAGVERLAHDVVPWMVRPPSTRARAEPGGAAGAWHSGACACDSPLAVGGAIERSAQTQCSSSDAIAAALSAAHEEHSRRQHELEREHQRALAQLAASHARQLIQAQRDKGALRDELERACDEWRASERGLYARVAHAELELAEKELELAHARAQAKTLRARADRLELRVADVELSRAAAASPQACGTSTLPSQSGTGSSASPSPPAGGAIAGDGSEERLRTLRSEIDLLLGIQGGRVRTAASEVGSLLGGATRLSRAPGGDGPAELSPLPSPLRRAAGISDGARARALAKGCLAIRAQVRLAKQQLAWLGRGVIESLRQTEAEWNRFVSTFSRLWEATVVGTEMLAADVGAAREAARGLDEHSARLDRALRARASVPTRVLAVAALPAPGDAVRCALDVRAQSIEVAEGPERRIFRFDRVAAIDTGATALPGLAPELGEAVDAVGAGGCATIIVDGPRGCGKSWLLDGSASEKGGDGLLGGAVHGLLAAIGELASAQPPQLCALWLSAVDVAGDVVTDLLAARALPRSCAVPSYERREGLHSQGSAVQPQLAAIPTYESFVQLNAHLRARIGTSVSGAERAAGQWVRRPALAPRATRARALIARARSFSRVRAVPCAGNARRCAPRVAGRLFA